MKKNINHVVLKTYFTLTPTSIGNIGLVWSDKGLCRLILPEKNDQQTKRKLTKGFSNVVCEDKKPTWIKDLVQQLNNYFNGKITNFDKVPLDIQTTNFQSRVYQELKKINYGHKITYKELAKKSGSELAHRAVGSAMRSNQIPIVIPCHRVVPTNQNSLGGYSAFGGLKTKKYLLDLESN